MPSFRGHLITAEPIVYAPERAGRPNAFGTEEVDVCPFCPGNEAMTPAEIERAGDPWRVRVFPNKYPAVAGHEVITESAVHHDSFDAIAHAPEVVATYVRRYRAHRQAAYISIFTNEGRRAGASIDHLHSQLMPLPFVPPRVARERAAFAAAERCPLCAALDHHRREGLVAGEDPLFTRIAPWGSSHPFEQWIVPGRHLPEIDRMSAEEMEGLAGALQQAVRGVRGVAGAYNVLFMNFPEEEKAHFYLAVVARLSALGGFELATGTLIDVIDPAAAARALR
ncbi:MAG TPA: DUF4921 family protein [Thermoanaerobaculia bacterium]|nr:DUF4921 family protein [Thermoanaerobaculia bacterium]